MSKRRFIQAIVIRTMPKLEKLADCVHYAENLWEGLTRHGYGAEQTQPRESKDWFLALNNAQQAGFRQFWEAFAYKKGRNDAAMRWGQLGELTAAETLVIVEAAKKEAQRVIPPGQVRKMASGWLFEKRWQDFQLQPAINSKSKIVELSNLKNRLAQFDKLHEKKPDPALKAQMIALEVQIYKLEEALNARTAHQADSRVG